LASALCGGATSLTQLVIYRLIQGVCGGAGLVPLSQSVLLRINPPEQHGQAVALWGTGVMLGPIFGPMLRDGLIAASSGRGIFPEVPRAGERPRGLPQARPGEHLESPTIAMHPIDSLRPAIPSHSQR